MSHWLIIALFLTTALVSCAPDDQPAASRGESFSERKAAFLAQALNDPYWQKRWWVEKTARILRGGEGLRPDEDVDALMALSKDEIIDTFLRDPRFADMVLDFNMYFLGFKTDHLREYDGAEESFVDTIYSFPSAIASAREVLREGDYFKLLDVHSPAYIRPLPLARIKHPSEASLSADQLQALRISEVQDGLRRVIALARGNPSGGSAEVCRRFFEYYNLGYMIQPIGIGDHLANMGPLGEPDWYPRVEYACKSVPLPSTKELAQWLEQIHVRNTLLFAQLPAFRKDRYHARDLNEIREIDTKAAGFALPWLQFQWEQRFAFQNSSTNFNRKRSAYILKHFFCDDLTPIGVENPASHAGGAHGSDPSCLACHYKLDPMAGFFRLHGKYFRDFSNTARLIFDDEASTSLHGYQNAWRNKPGSAREWEIGYVRAVNQDSLNDYGTELADLTPILRRAPEVKKCLVRRLHDYMIAENQTIDAGYLTGLAEKLTHDSQTNSTRAFKAVVRELAMSNGYQEPDLNPSQCYDFPKGHNSKNSPPCRVADLLQRNCVGCHKSTSSSGGLNLAAWTTLPDGNLSFPHLEDGVQVQAFETFSRIIERLSTSDPSERMPLKKFMSSQDRDEIYLWSQEMLTRTAPARIDP